MWFERKPHPTLVVTPIIHTSCVLQYTYNDRTSWHSPYHHPLITPSHWRGWRFPPRFWKPGCSACGFAWRHGPHWFSPLADMINESSNTPTVVHHIIIWIIIIGPPQHTGHGEGADSHICSGNRTNSWAWLVSSLGWRHALHWLLPLSDI